MSIAELRMAAKDFTDRNGLDLRVGSARPSAWAGNEYGFNIRSIQSIRDVESFVDMLNVNFEYFAKMDVLTLPRTSAEATRWLGKPSGRRVFGCFSKNGQCVGFCGVDLNSKLGNLFYAVAPQEQGKGVASALIAHATSYARRRAAEKGGVDSIDILVAEGNQRSVRAAESCGFRKSHQAHRSIFMRFGLNPDIRRFVFMECRVAG